MNQATLIVIGALWVALPLHGQGRPLTVAGVRGVTFGAVLQGVPRLIVRTDPANSGQIDIRGPNGSVLLTFVLPVAMTGPSGALLPVSFGASDAGFSNTQSIGSQVGFDPKQSFTAALPPNGRGSVFIGATASPATNQPAGTYSATITLNVTVLP